MTFFSIHNAQTQYGEIRVTGQPGDEKHSFKLLPSLQDGVAIAAHADASFLLRLKQRARLCGVMDANSNSLRKNSCRFFINGGLLGHVYTALSPTVFVELPPGDYELRIEALKNNKCAHTGWCLVQETREPSRELVTEENILFAVCSNYRQDNLDGPDRMLKRTSKKAGIRWNNMFTGGDWQGNYRRKIVDNLDGYRRARNSGKGYVLFVDARDVIVRHHLPVVLGRLNEIYHRDLRGKVLFAADAIGYNVPFEMKPWRLLLHRHLKESQVFANSGTYFGKLEDVIEMLSYAVKAYDALLNESAFDVGTEFLLNNAGRYALGRDQGYVQLYQMMHPERIKLDANKELFACITGDLQAKSDPTRYHPVLSHTICDASFVHAPFPSQKNERWEKMTEMILDGIDIQ